MTKGNVFKGFLMNGKAIIIFLFSFTITMAAMAQSTTESTTEQASGGQAAGMDDLPVKPFRMPSLSDVGGSPFLSAEYRNGSVELGQGRTVINVPLKFNTFNNAMMVMKNGEELKLEFFEFVSYNELDSRGNSRNVMFKAGYPEIDEHTENSIYQVLSIGPKVHFLKYFSQKVEEVPTLGDYSRREIVTKEEFYVFVPGSGMKKISSLKSGKKSLQEALPAELSAKIDEISTAKGLKLKNESEISILIEELNRP
jgi:hypothetical protein